MKPFRYQSECLEELEWFGGRALLALPPGLGKTMISLLHLARHPERLPAVVICPASVKWVWAEEARKWTDMEAEVLEGRNGRWTRSRPLTVLNYDILRHHLKSLRAAGFQTAILDECHYLADRRSRRTKASVALCKGVPSVLALSGTPATIKPAQMFSVLRVLKPRDWPNRWKFLQRYCDPKLTHWGWQFQGASHVEELHDKLLWSCMIRRDKREVLPDLPPKLRQIVRLPLSDPDEYQRANEHFLAWLAGLDGEQARRAAKVEALAKVGYLLRLSASLKLPATIGWLTDWLESCDEKIVVFAVHREIVNKLMHQLAQYRPVKIDGSVTGAKRRRIVEAFQSDPSIRVLIGNVKAAGVGITLTAARTVAFAELTWSPPDLIQAEDRCHRIGTTETVWIHYLSAEGTIEQRLCRVLHRRQRDLTGVLDGGRGDVLAELIGGRKS